MAEQLRSLKNRIREITRRAKGVSIKLTVEELASDMVGWQGYFGFCETPEVLTHSSGATQASMRPLAAVEGTRRRREALLQLRVRARLATNTAGSGRSPWYLARAKALSVRLSNPYFRSLDLPSLFENC